MYLPHTYCALSSKCARIHTVYCRHRLLHTYHHTSRQLLYGRKAVDTLAATKGWDLIRFTETQYLLWFDVAVTLLFACLASFPRITGMHCKPFAIDTAPAWPHGYHGGGCVMSCGR